MNQIELAIKKANKFLFANRGSDGLWTKKYGFKLPAHYDNHLVKSSQAIKALLSSLEKFIPKEHSKIEESIYQLINYEVKDDAPVDNLAFQLLITSFSNTKQAKKIREKVLEKIKENNKGGFWETYNNTYHFTNYMILEALQANEIELPKKFSNWAWSKLNKKKTGWGFFVDDEAQPSVTATILLSCLKVGVSAEDARIQKIVNLLEQKQNPDGGWPASSATEPKKSVLFSTALVVLCLLLSKGEIRRESVQKGIKYIIKTQNKDGSWGYNHEDVNPKFFCIYYAIHVLRFYNYIQETKNSQQKFLKERLKSVEYFAFMYSEYQLHIKNRFFRAKTKQLLNTRALGNTEDAQERRKKILNILSNKELDEAEIIDELRKNKKYDYLKKKTHLTLIKNDVSYLISLYLIQKNKHKYYTVIDLIKE